MAVLSAPFCFHHRLTIYVPVWLSDGQPRLVSEPHERPLLQLSWPQALHLACVLIMTPRITLDTFRPGHHKGLHRPHVAYGPQVDHHEYCSWIARGQALSRYLAKQRPSSPISPMSLRCYGIFTQGNNCKPSKPSVGPGFCQIIAITCMGYWDSVQCDNCCANIV